MSWEAAVLWMRDQAEMLDTVRDCYYDDPLINAARRYCESLEWQSISNLLSHEKGLALDIGAGRGISAFALTKEGWQVTALEPDKSDVVGCGAIRALSKQADLKIEIVEEWGERLPFSKDTFDLVHGRAVLHHADDLPKLCEEVARVLKPGGTFIAVREHVISKARDLPAFLENHSLHRLYGGENAFTLTQYTEAIKADGSMEMMRVLNPLATEINLFPHSRNSIKKMIAGRLKWPWPGLILDGLLTLIGHFYNKPGRLYSFVAKKKL